VRRDRPRVRLERKVAGVQEVDLGLREIAPVRLGAFREKNEVTLAPEDDGRRLTRAKVGVPLVVPLDVAAVVRVERELNRLVARRMACSPASIRFATSISPWRVRSGTDPTRR
jgi:hypothetical protein